MLNRCFSRGFTLIELIVTVTILAVLATLALPSFQAILANAQIRTAAQGLHDGLQFARAEAIRLNTRVIFTKNTASGWTVSRESPSATLQVRPGSEGSAVATVAVVPSAATKVTFNSLGQVVVNADGSGSISQLDVDVPTSVISAEQSKELRVTVSGGGAIRLCDPNAPAGTGRSC